MVLYGHFVMSHWAGRPAGDERGEWIELSRSLARSPVVPPTAFRYICEGGRYCTGEWRCGGPLRCPFSLHSLSFPLSAGVAL